MIFARLIFVSCPPCESHLVTRTVLNFLFVFIFVFVYVFVFVFVVYCVCELPTWSVSSCHQDRVAQGREADRPCRSSSWSWREGFWMMLMTLVFMLMMEWKNTSRLVQLPGAINQWGKVQPLCKSGDSRITLMMLKKCKKAHCKNQHAKKIKTFKKNEGSSLPCGEQSIAWGIPTDKQRWSRVNNYKDIDLTKKVHQSQDETWSRERWLERLSPFPSPTWRICTWKQGYQSIPFCFFIGLASFCVFLITFQLHRNLYSWPVLICVCVCVLHSANKEAGTYFNEYFWYISIY